MKFTAHTDNQPCILMFRIQTKSPEKVRIRVSDKLKPNAVYQDRWKSVNGEGLFYVRMPQSPKHADIEIGNILNEKNDRNIRIIENKILPLRAKFTLADIKDKKIKSFVEFAQLFCENAAILSAGDANNPSIYISDDRKYRINYFDVITDRKSGKPLNTPARINKTTGIIDIAKSKFEKYTIPMRIAILLHEFSHYFINNKMEDEEEADYNALLIYLGLGYPRIEAEKVFLKVFHGTPSDGNVERYKKIDNMIRNFEKVDFKVTNQYSYQGE